VRVEDAAAAVGMAPRRGVAGPQPAPHRLAFDAERKSDRTYGETLLAQPGCFGKAGVAAGLRGP